ncbi:MAG: cadherin-like domain-containing protein [Trichodesmium sp. St5_bin2_1]|mgnify:CR=1 FL=1|nr:cadherin-like domain-containing protein [Trichodesmium sp. St5_bin2_1]MDE5117854.1 cadherin-like domain-containing protein [Trichodesmium sp. St2_bin2_1]
MTINVNDIAKNIGDRGDDKGYGIATDSNGNVWVTGYFNSRSIDIDGNGTNDLTSDGGEDSYVAKFDSNGKFQWAQNIGSSSNDRGLGIATDSDGNVLATGYFSGSIDIDGNGTDDLTSNGGQDSYIAKFDRDGNFLWAQNIGGSNGDKGHSIAADRDGNVLATGYFRDSIDIDGNDINDLTSNGQRDSYVAKFDKNGNFLWAQNIGGVGDENGRGITTHSDGNVWITGYFDAAIDIDGDANNDLSTNGSSDSYIAKFDIDGNFQWAKNIGGSNGDRGTGIATDKDGNVLATGYFQGSMDIDEDGTDDLTSNGGQDGYMVKFDRDGNFLSGQNIGGESNDNSRSITTDSKGNVWATGYFEGSMDIDGDDTDDLTSNGGLDSYVAKFNSDGDFQWAKNLGGRRRDRGFAIARDNDGNVWATGYVNGSIDIDKNGTNDLISNARDDIYIIKFSENNLVNNPPVADDESFTMDEDGTPVTLDLLTGDTDLENDPLNIKSINGTELTSATTQTITVPNGTVNVAGDDTITFAPDPDYNGPINFNYIVEDGNGGEDIGTVTGTVNPINESFIFDITGEVIKFTPSSTEAEIIAKDGPSIQIGSQTIYIGTWQRTGNNQDPIIASFDSINHTNNWVRTDYETTGADARGRGLFWDGEDDLYAVFSVDGTQGTSAQDFRRATTDAKQYWLRSYGQGGGAKVSVLARIDIDDLTNPGEMTDAAYLTALLSNGKSNTLKVTDISLKPDDNLIVKADSYFSPRNPDGSRIQIPAGFSSPFDYTLVITPHLNEVLETEVIF